MSEQAASAWLKEHSGNIPAYDGYHQQVVDMFEKGVASMGEIADIIMLDPGLSTTILRKVNSKLKNNRRPVIETVHTAMGHLGKLTVTKLVKEHPVLSGGCDDTEVINRFRQLLCQNNHALAQVDSFSNLQGISTVDDMRAAMMLRNLGEFYLCLYEKEKYKSYRQTLTAKGNSRKLATKTFGFDFDDLSLLIGQHWNLPELLEASFNTPEKANRKARLIQLAAAVCREAETNWYSPAMLEVLKECAGYLNLNPDENWLKVQSIALQAAREERLKDVMPAAARFILLADIDKPAVSEMTRPTIKKTPKQASFEDRLRLLLQSRNANQSQVLGLLLDNLHRSLRFSRVALILLSGDKTTLTTRTGKGLDKESPFIKLKLEVSKSGMFKSLLQKPQAVCINATTYRKYENSLPGQFKATCLCDNFVLMSIFIGSRPIGLIYCDRSVSGEPIDKASYSQFKANIILTSKALAFLAKRKTRAAA